MAILDEAKKAGRAKYKVFRWSVDSGATGAWATADVHTPSGPVEGRILNKPRVHRGVSQVEGAAPPRTTISLSINNADRSLGPLLVGTASELPRSFYTGDSVLNLRGTLYAGYATATGAFLEQAITDELQATVTPPFNESTVNLVLSSRDDDVLGEFAYRFSVRALSEATWVANGQAQPLNSSAATAFDSTHFAAFRNRISVGFGQYLPFAFGRCLLPLVETKPMEGTAEGVLFVSRHPVDVTDFVSAGVLSNNDGFQIFDGSSTHGASLSALGGMWSVKVSIENEFSGAMVDLWIVGLTAALRASASSIAVLPPKSNRLSMNVAPFDAEPASPANIVRAMLTYLTVGGASDLDLPSFERAHLAIPDDELIGGRVLGRAKISDILEQIGRPLALSWAMTTAGKLSVRAPNAWSVADIAEAAGALPELRFGVDVHRYEVRPPVEPGQRGAAASRIRPDWSPEQQKFYPPGDLPILAPGVTTLKLGGSREIRIPAAWLNPDKASESLDIAAEARRFQENRIALICSDCVGLYPTWQKFRFTHPLGIGNGGATGESRRLLVLEEIEDGEGDFVLAIFQDASALEGLKGCVFDKVADWAHYDSVNKGVRLVLGPGGVMGRARAQLPSGAAWAVFDSTMVGSHLCVPGAANAANRAIAYRITALGGASPHHEVLVEFNFAATETIAVVPAATPLEDAAWCVLKSEETQQLDTILTCCAEATGLYRSGAEGKVLLGG